MNDYIRCKMKSAICVIGNMAPKTEIIMAKLSKYISLEYLAAKTRLGLASLFVLSVSYTGHAETFEEALISAYNSHPQLLAERARLREIDETYVQARAQGRLTSDINASSGFSDSTISQPSAFGPSNTRASLKPHSAQIQFVQPLYQGGRVTALRRQAKAGVLSARENLRRIEQDILLSTATAYVDVMRDESIARLRRQNVRVLDKQEVASLERFRLRDGTKTDVAQSRSRIAGAEISLAQADAQLASSRAFYIEAVGHPPSALSSAPNFVLPASLVEAQRVARQGNPQLIAAAFNEQAGDAAIKLAKSARRPSLTLNGSYQASEDQSTNLTESETSSIVAQLRIPLLTGGLTGSQVRSAKHARTRLVHETRAVERSVDRQVAQLWGQLSATKRSLVASQTQAEAAEGALKGVELEKKVGTRTTLDVLDAEEELLNAQLTLVQVKRNLDVIHFQFLTLLGAFDAKSLRLGTDYYDPTDNFRSVKFKGQDAIIDRYVPEAVQKIGKQLPNIPNDVIGLVSDTGIPTIFKRDLSSLSSKPPYLGNFVKEAVDAVTFQNPEYGAKVDDE